MNTPKKPKLLARITRASHHRTLILVSALAIGTAAGRDIYINTQSGNNNNNGSYNSPKKTLAAGFQALRKGDTLNLRGGQTFYERNLKLTNFWGDPITTIKSYGGGRASIHGKSGTLSTNWSDREFGIVLENGNNLRIENLNFYNINGQAVRLVNSWNCRVTNCNFWNIGGSAIIGERGANLQISGNTITKAVMTFYNECITAVGMNDVRVHNNTVKDRVAFPNPNADGGEGVDLKVGCTNCKIYSNTIIKIDRMNLYIDGWDKNSYNHDIYNNYTRESKSPGVSIAHENGGNGTSTKNVWVWNNCIFKNSAGIFFGANGIGSAHPVGDIRFHFNTVDSCNGGFNAANSYAFGNNQCAFNIFSACVWNRIEDPHGKFGVWNNVQHGSGRTKGSGPTGWPQFVGGAWWDANRFKLKSNSNARNRVTNSGGGNKVGSDRNGKWRGATRDLGALEY